MKNWVEEAIDIGAVNWAIQKPAHWGTQELQMSSESKEFRSLSEGLEVSGFRKSQRRERAFRRN